MPLQNRVDPFGALFRTPARGSMMGNRGGVLHDERREIVRPFLSRRWIACVLEFKGRHRTVMSPRRYTELFFLDEAVALAAGHRPCAECRRASFRAFQAAWEPAGAYADEMDARIHAARIDAARRKVTYQGNLKGLPDGCFVAIDGEAALVWEGGLRRWSPEGYRGETGQRGDMRVTVLTPAPMVECLRRGYRPQVHPSATLA